MEGKADYEKEGLKVGLEIHQQLDCGKLFCKCAGYLRNDEAEFIVKRKLHKVAGELGEIDVAVEHEAFLDREFVYQGYNDSSCLVELDEEPPHQINEDALNEALKIALLLNCEIYPAVQIMRKTVIDGSNTSGFQRTLLIAHDGFIETSLGKVAVENVALEEDAARIVSKNEKQAIYKLDRLGIPLVEISTAPSMHTPEHVKETALKIGEILRACRVKRGIGTIRQDVNVNVKGHDKVEIKGFQEPKIMIKTIDLEMERQKEELKKGKKTGEVRNTLDDGKTEFMRPMPGQARMYPETDLPLLKMGKEKINELKKNLPRMRHEIKEELKKKGLSDELVNLVLDGNLEEFNILMKVYDKDAPTIAKIVSLWRDELASKLKKSSGEIKNALNEAVLEKIIEKLQEGKIRKDDVKEVMLKIAEGMKIEEALKVEKISDDELEQEIRGIIKEKPGLSINAYMGLAMAKLKGKIDAKKAMEILRRIVKSE